MSKKQHDVTEVTEVKPGIQLNDLLAKSRGGNSRITTLSLRGDGVVLAGVYRQQAGIEKYVTIGNDGDKLIIKSATELTPGAYAVNEANGGDIKITALKAFSNAIKACDDFTLTATDKKGFRLSPEAITASPDGVVIDFSMYRK